MLDWIDTWSPLVIFGLSVLLLPLIRLALLRQIEESAKAIALQAVEAHAAVTRCVTAAEAREIAFAAARDLLSPLATTERARQIAEEVVEDRLGAYIKAHQEWGELMVETIKDAMSGLSHRLERLDTIPERLARVEGKLDEATGRRVRPPKGD